ncbi:hypothetical protein BDP27DRAFT_1312103 [Rhodocollybia butyracea]|uniref:DUF6535 domain-containing protein n=1 Tax=Rhodocollybia butyracea TaxID=206335 RepID=A0A9P5Q9Q4_9AGAR|nr:hypothetical protein BDP27DRAFT_1312103 [Rhodocollybia butyracea]
MNIVIDPPNGYAEYNEQKSIYAHTVKTANDIPLSSRLWTPTDHYRYAISPKTGDHWEKVNKRVETFDEDICKGWREDIDTLLVFAGLFSSAVTAFLIESYGMLQPSSSQTVQNLLLLQIIQQTGNSTIPLELLNPKPSVTSLAIRLNVFWFSSLALGLSTAIICILCKQWLREYRRDAALSPKDALMLRQIRLESFEQWRVEGILSALPLLLQSALVLFFAGIVDLLWSLNTIVATVLTCEIGFALLAVSMTTVLPSLTIMLNAKLPCAYKSPQAWIFYRASHWFTRFFKRIQRARSIRMPSRIKNWTAGDRICSRFADETAEADVSLPNDCLGAAMNWVYSEYRGNVSMAPDIFYCLEELSEETLAVATGKANLNARYYLYCDLVKGLPPSRERHKFSIELLLRDINGASSLVEQCLYISHLAAELRFGIAVDTDEDFLLQTIDTVRNFVQCSFDGPALNYQSILDVSYIFLYCWRDGSEDVRRHTLLVLDDIERCIERLTNPTSRPQFGCDFTWLMYRSAENTSPGPDSQEFYNPFICSERFLLFVRFLDGYHRSVNDMDPSHPIISAWKQQKVSLAIQGGLPASYFDLEPTSSPGSSDYFGSTRLPVYDNVAE